MSVYEELKTAWVHISPTPIDMQKVGGRVYCFGAERACLRLLCRLNRGKMGFSAMLNCWFFYLELHDAAA